MLAVGSALLVSHAPSSSSLLTPFTSFLPLSFNAFCYHFFLPVFYLLSLSLLRHGYFPLSFLSNRYFVHLLCTSVPIFSFFIVLSSYPFFLISILSSIYTGVCVPLPSNIYACMRRSINRIFSSIILQKWDNLQIQIINW